MLEKEEGEEEERERNAECTEEREKREREPTADSKYPPDTLHLSLPFPPLAISRLTHRAATEQHRTVQGDGERDGEKERSIFRNASRTGDRLKSF